MKLGVDVQCVPHDEGVEIQTKVSFDEAVAWTNRELVRLKDEAVRNALIALGWTPPPGMQWD